MTLAALNLVRFGEPSGVAKPEEAALRHRRRRPDRARAPAAVRVERSATSVGAARPGRRVLRHALERARHLRAGLVRERRPRVRLGHRDGASDDRHLGWRHARLRSAADYLARLTMMGTTGFSVYLGESMPEAEWSSFSRSDPPPGDPDPACCDVRGKRCIDADLYQDCVDPDATAAARGAPRTAATRAGPARGAATVGACAAGGAAPASTTSRRPTGTSTTSTSRSRA